MNYDVFNGDADGICALIQLYLFQPERAKNELVTDIKRNINLLKLLPNETQNSVITILDISLDKNRVELEKLLKQSNQILYADHHFSGDIPADSNLKAHIDTQANTCTSLIIHEQVVNKYPLWAITGAYGDNMMQRAEDLAEHHQVSKHDRSLLKELGTYINYNGYGASIDDLHFNPKDLFLDLVQSENPLDIIADPDSCFAQLKQAYENDMKQAENAEVYFSSDKVSVIYFEDAKWSRRVNGVYGNELANREPDMAHASIIPMPDNTVNISVRAPLNNKTGADEICRQFANGGGRKAAAGINSLAENEIDKFILAFSEYYQ
ncbi:MAG: DHH family phosphoesterase [Gammaproteobacteria bacterium]|nr:DHH family phosphoesterase [Gammaproteobacteria bacterium]